MIYRRCFEQALKAGEDVLYLCFSSGMSGTLQSANLCAEELREEYPARRLIVLDTLCASVGQAMLVREAARKQQEGLSIDELAAWVEENRLKICHWFTVDSFDHLKHGGRVSAAAAAVGTMLQIKPLLHVDDEGKLRVAEKPRGRKQAIRTQIAHMKEGWTPEMGRLVVIGHGDCPEDGGAAPAGRAQGIPGCGYPNGLHRPDHRRAHRPRHAGADLLGRKPLNLKPRPPYAVYSQRVNRNIPPG